MNSRFIPLIIGAVSLACNATEPTLVYHTTFDSVAAVTSPAVGVGGTVGDSAVFVVGKVGKAMQIPAQKDGIKVSLPASAGGAAGTVEFWGRIDNDREDYGTTGDPTFFRFGWYRTYLTIGNNSGVGTSGINCRTIGGSILATRSDYGSGKYSELFPNGTEKGWHHYALVWDKDGIPGVNKDVALYIDGVLSASGDWESDEFLSYFASEGVELQIGDSGNDSLFTIDEFKIWNGAKTTFDLNPQPVVDPVTVSSVTAKQHYPWCGKVDIGYTVAGSTDGLQVKITVKDNTNDKTYEAKTFDVAPTAAVGAHTVVWDATADGVTTASQNMVATVSLIVPEN